MTTDNKLTTGFTPLGTGIKLQLDPTFVCTPTSYTITAQGTWAYNAATKQP